MKKQVFILIVILIIISAGMIKKTEGFRCTNSYSLDASGNTVTKRVCPQGMANIDPKWFLLLLLLSPIIVIWNRGSTKTSIIV